MHEHHARIIPFALPVFPLARASFPAPSHGQKWRTFTRTGWSMKKLSFALALLLLCGSVFVSPARAACTIDDEEYAVLAAVLFPNEPDVPDGMKSDPERNAYVDSVWVNLSGFHGSSYRIQDETVPQKSANVPDQFMDKDFYEKNGQACKIDGNRLLAHVAERGRVSFVTAGEIEKGIHRMAPRGRGQETSRRRAAFSDVTYLSRPGFNESRTEAMVEAHHQAGPEMGVGYRVYLQKSPKTGKWFIAGARRTRIS